MTGNNDKVPPSMFGDPVEVERYRFDVANINFNHVRPDLSSLAKQVQEALEE